MKTAKTHFFFLCVFIFGFSSCNQKTELKIETTREIKSKMDLNLIELQARNKLGKDTVVTIENDPVYRKTKSFKAVSALELIQREFDLSKIDIQNTKIIFECIDGYQPEMPLALFLSTKSYLAFQDMDAPSGSNWEKITKGGNEMDATPFYLVYSSVPVKDSRYKWPYNLTKIHLKPLNESRVELFPSDNENLISGYNLFQKHCITCHSLNSTGGKMGPELNFPKSVTEYWKEKELVDFIVNPAAFRNQVKMPNLGLSLQESQEIIDYLKYMAKRKKKG
jgi:cytochrome c2